MVQEFAIIDLKVPPLLPLGLLEHLGAVVDLPGKVLKLTLLDLEVSMTTLGSGHQAVNFLNFQSNLLKFQSNSLKLQSNKN